jgi:hypothetical protein
MLHGYLHASLRWSVCATVIGAVVASHALAADSTFKTGDWPLLPLARPAVPVIDDSAALVDDTVIDAAATTEPAAAQAIQVSTTARTNLVKNSATKPKSTRLGRSWVKNPIDAFVLERLIKSGLRPNPPADKLTLLRRVTVDLLGLPPTPAEQAAFLKDRSTDAYVKVVDRLLSSPNYGERWAQYWLDLIRYAETAGFKKDDMRPDAYKYRDYVIRAFNQDLPYNRFIEEQLAGDELEPDNPDALIATGLNRLYPEETNASNFVQARQAILDDVTDVTGQAFMGLTIGCAKCHDHKFDPILQTDFYRLQAFFASILPDDDIPAVTPDQLKRYEEKLKAWKQATASVRKQLDDLLDPERKEAVEAAVEACDPATQLAVETPPEKRTPLQMQLAELADETVQKKLRRIEEGLDENQKKRYAELTKALAKFDSLKPLPLPTAMAVTDTGVQAPPTFCLAAGDYNKPLQEVTPGFLECLTDREPKIATPAVAPHSTGRRSALAHWLTQPDHPLTARVMANRIWQHHFGVGIVATENDFGEMGSPPSHRDMLDWLAAEFVSSGWSMKAIHRLIVTSNTYGQSSAVDPEDDAHVLALKTDPNDHLLWHFHRRRLEGEAIRDAALQISGQLNRRMFGPSAKPELPAVLLSSRYSWEADANPEDRNRRSIYVIARRNLRYPLLAAFDPADMHNSCARRSSTTTAPQALALLNSDFMLDQARHWSGNLMARYPQAGNELIAAAYVDAYGRQPTADEIAAADEFLAEQARRIASASEVSPALLPDRTPQSLLPADAAAIVDLCHAIMNSTEFLYVD